MKPYIAVVSPRLTSLLSVVIDVHNITLWPFIISAESMSPGSERHERTHVWQQIEVNGSCTALAGLVLVAWGQWPWLLMVLLMGWAPFYVLYGAGWLYHRARGLSGPDAYRQIIFEREAYAHDDDQFYLEGRHPFAWLRE